MSEAITYKVDKVKRSVIITLNQPDSLNSLNNDQYLLLAELVKKANDEPDTTFTVLQSTGRYFSSGANVKDGGIFDLSHSSQTEQDSFWLSHFVARNVYLTSLFLNHTKILVACLNGPVIGLSAALVSLCDLVYAINDKDVFMLLPFSNLGLVCEGAASALVVRRLGLSKANELILLSRPMPVKELDKVGFVNEMLAFSQKEVAQFNEAVLNKVYDLSKNLLQQSLIDNKQLMKEQYYKDYQFSNANEVIKGFEKWSLGIPQERFLQMAKKQRRHKL